MSFHHPRHDMLYRRNSYTDVVRLHRLPNEVLSNIMCAGLDLTPDEPARAHWLTSISSTCALWRHIALKTPSLWTRVAFYLEEDGIPTSMIDPQTEAFLEARVRRDYAMVDAFMKRSGALRLAVHVTWSSVDAMPRASSLQRFAALLNAHSHRIGTLVYHAQCSPTRLPGLALSLPSSLLNLTHLEMRTEVVDVPDNGVPHVFPTSEQLMHPASGTSMVDLASPWNLATLHAPKLRAVSYRAYMPTPRLAKLVARCEHLETLAINFDALPEGEARREEAKLVSSSLRTLMIGGDIWALESILGYLPFLEHLKTFPKDIVCHDEVLLTTATRTITYPSLKTLDLMPYQPFADEDAEFIRKQPKLQQLDLFDSHFPALILEGLVEDLEPSPRVRSRRPSCSSNSSTGSSRCSSRARSPAIGSSMAARSPFASSPKSRPVSPSAGTPPLPSVSSSRRMSPYPTSSSSSPSSSRSASPFLRKRKPIPNPSLRVLRLHRSRLSPSTEEEWQQLVALSQTLLLQRPTLSVHFVGAGTNGDAWVTDPSTGIPEIVQVMRCEPELYLLSRMFGDRVWISTSAEDVGSCASYPFDIAEPEAAPAPEEFGAEGEFELPPPPSPLPPLALGVDLGVEAW
ncbi:hypothetical protein DL93DRAFT_2092837 [Clavulina sp. PMI_390]|nr:hypothetical protein DL93DRAFT_2092837 [Clavulina sp. PMI_390]